MDFGRYRKVQQELLQLGQNILALSAEDGETMLQLLKEKENLSRKILQQLQNKLQQCLTRVTQMQQQITPLQESLSALENSPVWQEKDINSLQELDQRLDTLLAALSLLESSPVARSAPGASAGFPAAASREEDGPVLPASSDPKTGPSSGPRKNHPGSPPRQSKLSLPGVRCPAPATLAELEQLVQAELKKQQTGLLPT
ncbi:MAG: hypothetical protein ACUVTU_02530 [Desulfurispora sp.]|uniref:hypothetical protein n=1 Tax=Desulfurispora sp. TaxID=3014275 RepID=UPI00404A24C1